MQALNYDDLRRLAKRRLPKVAFDFIEGGVEDEDGLARNDSAFANSASCPSTWWMSARATSPRRSSAAPTPTRSASPRPAALASSGMAPT